MPRVDETQVIVGTLVADTPGGVETDDSKSPAYTDTEVTQNERSVTFKNSISCSDTSNGKERKFVVSARAEGHGLDETGTPEEHVYTSPLSAHPLTPEVEIDVPDQSLSQYDFTVTTPYALYEKINDEWTELAVAAQGPETATVNDNSSS